MNKITILCLMLAIFASCDKEDIMRYDRSRAAIEFDDDEVHYSFKTSFKTVDTISIPFSLVGYAEDWVRNAEFAIVADSTTAEADEYEIILIGILVFVTDFLRDFVDQCGYFLRIHQVGFVWSGIHVHRSFRIELNLHRPER